MIMIEWKTCGDKKPWFATDAMSTPIFQKLPKNLLLQLDNYAGENKNCYLFAYLSLLVAKGVLKTVHLGFLMVGHTHKV